MITMFRLIAILISLGVLLLIFYIAPDSRGFLGQQLDTVGYVSIAALLYLGIVFGALHRQLISGAGDVDVRTEIQKMIASRHFWIAVAGSPFVLLGVYAILQEKPVDLAALALTFQNGFFCERVIASLQKQEIHEQN